MIGVTYKQAPQYKQRVYYSGTTTLTEGFPLCYNSDYGTAASIDAQRAYEVEDASTSNNKYFAGVVTESYAGVTNPQWIEIYLPGSYCNVQTDLSCTIDVTTMTFKIADDEFGVTGVGFDGRGTALAKQTIDRSSTAGLCYAYLQDGPESGGIAEVTPAATGGAQTGTVSFGVTYHGTVAAPTAAATYTIADAVRTGARVAAYCNASMGTSADIQATITSHVTSDPEVYYMDAADEYVYCAWYGDAGGKWQNLALTAATS